MKNENIISTIFFIISLTCIIAAYMLPRLFNKMYYYPNIFHLLIIGLALIGIASLIISAYLNPKIGGLPLLAVLLFIMSTISVTHRQTLDIENGTSTQTLKGWPFRIYELTNIVGPKNSEMTYEKYLYRGMILNFILAAGVVTLVCIKKLKIR